MNSADDTYLKKGKLERNRKETRETLVFLKDKFKDLLDNEWEKYIKVIIVVKKNINF